MICAGDDGVSRSQILFMPHKYINPDFTLSIRDGVRSFQVNVVTVRTAQFDDKSPQSEFICFL